MSEFIKPKRVLVPESDYRKHLVETNLQKDLQEDEEICPWCHGIGLVIEDNVYGLSNDPDKTVGRFPYKHQSISFCQHCYNGVVHRCRLCGEIMPRGRLKHDCEAQRKIDAEVMNAKSMMKFNSAPVMGDEEAEKLECFQSDYYPYNEGYFYDWDEFFDAYYDGVELNCEDRPEYVWATEYEDFKMDARRIVEDATDDLYEDAFYNIKDAKIKELQDFLDKWCSSCGVGRTYFIGKKKVRIPWERCKV